MPWGKAMGGRRRGLLISVVLGLLLLVAVVWMARPGAILARMGILGAGGIAALVFNGVLGFSCGVEGWRWLLRAQGIRAPFPPVFRIMSGGYALGYSIPSCYLAGEPVRALWASREFSAPGHKVVAAIVLEKVLLAAGTAVILFWAGAVGLQGELPSALRQGVFSLAGAAAFIAGATLVGATRRTPWASRCLTFARRFLPRWAFLERGNKALLEVQTALQKALSDHREAVAKAAGFIALMVCFNALAPLIFFALAYSRILSAEELAVFLALGNISSLLFWLTPGGIGVAEGAYVGIFKIMGLPIDGAVTFALAQRIASLPIVALGFFYLSRQGVTELWRWKHEKAGSNSF